MSKYNAIRCKQLQACYSSLSTRWSSRVYVNFLGTPPPKQQLRRLHPDKQACFQTMFADTSLLFNWCSASIPHKESDSAVVICQQKGLLVGQEFRVSHRPGKCSHYTVELAHIALQCDTPLEKEPLLASSLESQNFKGPCL